MRQRPPNILLILSDQEQHWRNLPRTLVRPGLDWLRESGIGFLNHHVTTVPCGPSRSTIYAGQHTQHTGVLLNPRHDRNMDLPLSMATLGSMLRENGYYTAYKGKWHISAIPQPRPFAQTTADVLEPYGFSEFNLGGDPVGTAWDGFRGDPATASDVANWLLGYSGAKPSDAPWFLAVNFVNPHDVMFFDTGRSAGTGKGASGLQSGRLPAPRGPVYERAWDEPLPRSFFETPRERQPEVHVSAFQRIQRLLGEISNDDLGAWVLLRDYYWNCLRDLDSHVLTVLDALRAAHHDHDTIVIYSTDHGEFAGAHGFREKFTSCYREVMNVPLVVRHPDCLRGTETSALSSAVDLVPTILSFAGLDRGDWMARYPGLTGCDLSDIVGGTENRSERDDRGILLNISTLLDFDRFRFEMDSSGNVREYAVTGDARGAPAPQGRVLMRGLVLDRWKFARYFAVGDHGAVTGWSALSKKFDLELYDLMEDADELSNLAYRPEYKDTVVELSRELDVAISAEIGLDDGSDIVDASCRLSQPRVAASG